MLATAVFAMVLGGATALAAVVGNTERVTGLWASAQVSRSGDARVTEVIDYDFGTGLEDKHGIYRDVPGLSPEAEVSVTSASAPVPYELIDMGSQTRIRIGDPTLAVHGLHRYRIRYHLDDVAPHGKLAWDAVGAGWRVELSHVEIHVAAPFELGGARCVQGATGSRQKCAVSGGAPGSLTVELDRLGAGKGATLYADAGRRLTDPVTAAAAPSGPVRDSGAPGKLWPGVLATVIALAAAAFTACALRFAGRDRVAGDAGRERRVDAARLASSLTPSSRPPEGLSPAQAGVLLTERIEPEHKVAWLISTAADGHLDIDDNDHYPVLRRRPPEDAPPTDRNVKAVLDQVFAGRDSAILGVYDRYIVTAWDVLDKQLARWQGSCGLWDPAGAHRSRVARRAGVIAAGVGPVLVITGGVLSSGAGPAWQPLLTVGAVLAGAGLSLAVRARELRVRTARGTALWMEVESFRRYLAAAGRHDADGLTHSPAVADTSTDTDTGSATAPEPDAERPERYTAWAVALGEIDRWSESVTESTTAPSAATGPTRRPMNRMPLYGPAIALTLVSSAAASTRPPSSSGSGSGSGSSSGSGGSDGGVGGGAGGGGGGSW
ncbi:DUF2207 domain-containing protein [Streptomyces sp. NPDC056975]|uniref:DUF2207 domain-containing protein n=1 Tax=Streptomyces sp. NPDC056975 TaxID=3345985 RepID=UPI003643DE54